MADILVDFPLDKGQRYKRDRGISDAEAAEAGFQYVKVTPDVLGVIPNLLPYRDEWGMLIPYPNHPEYFGFRRIDMRTSGFGTVYNPKTKYLVQKGPPRAYIPNQEPLKEGGLIVITESVIKALIVYWTMGPDVYVIGLNGCQGYSSPRDGDRDRLMRDMVNVPWHRAAEVLVLFDSNVATNPDVEAAAARLVHILDSRFRTNAKALILPHAPDDAPWGLDDYAVHHGRDALKTFIETAPRVVPAFTSDLISNFWELRNQYCWNKQTGEWFRIDDGRIFTKETVAEATMAQYRHDSGTAKGFIPTWTTYRAWSQRSEVNRMIYRPGEDKFIGEDYNIYNPPSLRAVDGDVSFFLDYLRRLMPVEEQREAFLRVLAALRQRPGQRSGWIVILASTLEGIGKSALANLAMALVGSSNAASVVFENLVGHNEMMVGRHVLKLDDVGQASTRAERRTRSSLLRRIATDETFTVNPKNEKVKEYENFITIFLSSNAIDGGIELLEQGRREFFPDLAIPYLDERGGVDRPKVVEAVTWMLGDGLPAIAGYLDRYELGTWPPQQEPPASNAKRRAAEHSRTRFGDSWEIAMGNLFSGDEERRGDQLEDLKMPRGTRYFTRERIRMAVELADGGNKWCGDNYLFDYISSAMQYHDTWRWKCRAEKGTKAYGLFGKTVSFYDMIGGPHDLAQMARDITPGKPFKAG